MEEKLQNLTMSKALLIGIVILGFYWATFYGDGSDIEIKLKTAQDQLKKKKNELEASKKTIKDAARFEEVANRLGKQMEKVTRAIPEELSMVELMKLLSTEAKIAGANILSISEGKGGRKKKRGGQRFKRGNQKKGQKKEDDPFFEEMSVNVDLECTFTQLMVYLSNLTRADKILTLKELGLKSINDSKGKSGPDGSPMLAVKAVISAYRYTENAGAQ